MRFACLVLLASSAAAGDPRFVFTTEKHSIEMRVSFPAPYEGTRLAVYGAGRKQDCLSIEAGAWGCTERFVGSVAVVNFTVKQKSGAAPAATIREAVTLLDQSPGLPGRAPHTSSIRLIDGVGSDLQAFGYDESPLAEMERAAGREAARSAWRRFRQELYLDGDRQPFAVLEWEHAITAIRLLRVHALRR